MFYKPTLCYYISGRVHAVFVYFKHCKSDLVGVAGGRLTGTSRAEGQKGCFWNIEKKKRKKWLMECDQFLAVFELQWAHSKMMQSRTLTDVMALAHSLLRDAAAAAAAAVTLYLSGTCLCLTTVSASLRQNTAALAEHESERPITLQITMVIQRSIYRASVEGLIKLPTTKGSHSQSTVSCIKKTKSYLLILYLNKRTLTKAPLFHIELNPMTLNKIAC